MEIKDEVLKIVKTKITDDQATDDMINPYIDEIEFLIKQYCNIPAVPYGLLYTWANMAYELYVKRSAFQFGTSSNEESEEGSGTDSQAVKSFSVDGIGMTFVTGEETQSQETKDYQAYKNLENLLLDYVYMLDKYRKLVW